MSRTPANVRWWRLWYTKGAPMRHGRAEQTKEHKGVGLGVCWGGRRTMGTAQRQIRGKAKAAPGAHRGGTNGGLKWGTGGSWRAHD